MCPGISGYTGCLFSKSQGRPHGDRGKRRRDWGVVSVSSSPEANECSARQSQPAAMIGNHAAEGWRRRDLALGRQLEAPRLPWLHQPEAMCPVIRAMGRQRSAPAGTVHLLPTGPWAVCYLHETGGAWETLLPPVFSSPFARDNSSGEGEAENLDTNHISPCSL